MTKNLVQHFYQSLDHICSPAKKKILAYKAVVLIHVLASSPHLECCNFCFFIMGFGTGFLFTYPPYVHFVAQLSLWIVSLVGRFGRLGNMVYYNSGYSEFWLGYGSDAIERMRRKNAR
jgi:hypothetical protein